MAEQNVVPMSDAAEDAEDAKKTATARCLSELVSVTMGKAAARLSSVDEDPIYREATVRAGIRDFSRALRQHFPDLRDALPDYLTAAANELTGGPGHQQTKTTARNPATAGGARSYAEHQRPAGKSGG